MLRIARIALIAFVPVFATTLLSAPPADAQPGPDDGEPRDRLTVLGEYFDRHPEQRAIRGSGWKPYNRAKWFVEQRSVDGRRPRPDALWRAWDRARRTHPASARARETGWFARGPSNLAGRIMALKIDPNDPTVLYAGSSGGGLWRSTDSGGTWSPLTDDLPAPSVGAVVVLPSDSDVILIGTGMPFAGAPGASTVIGGVGVLRSTNAGVTWQITSLSYPAGPGHAVHCMEVDPISGVILAGASDGLWRSTDDGATWSQVKIGGDFYDVCWKPGDAGHVYAGKGTGAGRGVHVSADGGATWSRAGTGQPPSFLIGRTEIAVSAAAPAIVTAYYTDPNIFFGYATYRSTDDGATWTQQSTVDIAIGQAWHNLVLEADPQDADVLFGGGVILHRSTDGGVTWAVSQDVVSDYIHVDHQAIVFRPGSSADIVLGADQGIWESTDGGATWTPSNDGLVTYQFYDVCAAQSDPTFAVGGTQDNGTDRYVGSTLWSHGLGADGMVCNIDPANASLVYGEIQFGDHHRSTDAGATWTSINAGIPAGNTQWVVPVGLDRTPGNAGHLYTAHRASGGAGSLYRTSDGGDSWSAVASFGATWIDLSPVDGDVVWTVGDQAVQLSTNDGATWTAAAPFPFSIGNETKILAHPTDVATAYVTFSGYGPGLTHVAQTSDFGATWHDLTANLPEVPVNAIAVDPQNDRRIYVGTDLSVWATTDAGATWAPFGTGLPFTMVSDLEIREPARKLLAATYGRGAWEADLPTSGTDASVTSPPPSNVMLDTPIPNPVSHRTTLRWAARFAGEVRLDVYDVGGRRVTPVARRPTGDGIIRTARWSAEDHPAGVYFAVLAAGDDRVSRKIVVTK